MIWSPHNDLWRFALYALVIYVRATSERIGDEPATIARRIAAGHHVPLPEETARLLARHEEAPLV